MPEQDPAVEMALIRADLEAVQAELKAVRKELKDLLEAWNTATGVVRFVKWLSTLVAAIAVFFLLDLRQYLSLEAFKASRAQIDALHAARPLTVAGLYLVAYVAVAALSLPGAAVMTLIGDLNQRYPQQPGFGQDLEAVADAQHRHTALCRRDDRAHHW